jgi:hypothetical protein
MSATSSIGWGGTGTATSNAYYQTNTGTNYTWTTSTVTVPSPYNPPQKYALAPRLDIRTYKDTDPYESVASAEVVWDSYNSELSIDSDIVKKIRVHKGMSLEVNGVPLKFGKRGFLELDRSMDNLTQYAELKINVTKDCYIQVNDSGYKIFGDDGKVKYKGCESREFNEFINATDLMEEFIRFLGKYNVRQDEVLQIPVELFINWLVIKACEKDREEPPEGVLRIEQHPKLLTYKKNVYGRCKFCGKFISRKKVKYDIMFCSGKHVDRYLEGREI